MLNRHTARALQLAIFATLCLVGGIAYAQTVPPPAGSPLDLGALLKLVQGHQWLPLAILGVGYLRLILSNKSRFPVTLSASWLNVVSALGGALFGLLVAMQAGVSPGLAVASVATTGALAGIVDALATALFGADPTKVPAWFKWIAGLSRDVVTTPEPAIKVGANEPPKPRGFGRVSLLATLAAVGLMACSLFGQVAPPAVDCGLAIAVDAAKGMSIAQIFAADGQRCGQDLTTIATTLLQSTEPKVTASPAFAEAVHMQTALAAVKH